jgi:hypothetical protein
LNQFREAEVMKWLMFLLFVVWISGNGYCRAIKLSQREAIEWLVVGLKHILEYADGGCLAQFVRLDRVCAPMYPADVVTGS